MPSSVGYRVKSTVATRFRIWATRQLREYIVKGFLLDDERLKNPDQPFDYFDELMRRIQENSFSGECSGRDATAMDCGETQQPRSDDAIGLLLKQVEAQADDWTGRD